MTAESSSSDGEKPTAQASFLPEFSTGKAQDLDNPTGRNPNRSHVTAESLSSAGERPTAKTGFLTDFFAEKLQHLSYIKLEPTPQTGSHSLIMDQVNKPNFGGKPT